MTFKLAALSAGLCLALTSLGSVAADYKAGDKAVARSMDRQADLDYKAAKKNCKSMKGGEKKSCLRNAKAAHEKAEADGRGVHEMSEAKTTQEKSEVAARTAREKAEADKKAQK